MNMRISAARWAQCLFVVLAGVGASGAAHAQSYTWGRLRNADTSQGTFYLGVAGGETCKGTVCGLVNGTKLVTWQKAGIDQVWGFLNDPAYANAVSPIMDDAKDGSGDLMVVGYPAGTIGKNTQLTIAREDGLHGGYWTAVSAESLGAPFPGCFGFITGDQETWMYMSVYQGNVKNGSPVVLWPLCIPGSGNCGNPSSAWHADQFWCPDNS